MSRNDDFTGQLEDYLVAFDGLTPLPDHVHDAIRAELPSVRQVQGRPGPLRLLTMLSNASAGARFGLAAATVVAAVALGAAFLNNNQRGGVVGDAPTPSPTATPSASLEPTPSATAAPSGALQPPPLDAASVTPCNAVGDGCVEAGTYRLSGAPGVWPATVSIDVPAGWFEWSGGIGWEAVLVGDANGPGSGWGVMFYTVGDVARDPCDSSKGSIPAAQVATPRKLAAAMAAWPRFTATSPQPITVGGHSGLTFKLTSTAKASCASAATAGLSASGAPVDVYPMVDSSGAHDPVTVEIVDTGNGLLVIRATDFAQTSPYEVDNGVSPDPTFHAGDLAELHAILDSIRLSALPATP